MQIKCYFHSLLTCFCSYSTCYLYYRPHPKDGEGNSFSLFVSPHLGGVPPSPSHDTSTGPMSFSGVPQWLVPGPFLGGTPVTGPVSLPMGYPLGQVRMGGIPGWGTPWLVLMGGRYPRTGYPPQSRDRVPQIGMGYPPQPGMGYSLQIGQQTEHLICCRRYASCIHAGGLSCWK